MLEIEITKPTLLLVDDEPVNLRVLKQLLANDYQLIFARNGEEALKLAQTRQPNLILLDVMMPGLTGFEVCRQLKQLSSTRHIPVIFVTALNDEHEETEGFEEIADWFETLAKAERSHANRYQKALDNL